MAAICRSRRTGSKVDCMAVLSNTEIVKALDDGRLVIDPRPHPDPGAKISPYDTVSVDLQLAPTILIPKKNLNIIFDPSGPGNVATTLKTVCESKQVGSDGFTLDPGQFILGNTVEEVSLPPIGGVRLAARIEGRSSLARLGLIVHCTAPTIHAEFSGNITLEITNLGKYPIKLRSKMRICQLIVETVEGVPVAAQSQFHGQRDPAGRS